MLRCFFTCLLCFGCFIGAMLFCVFVFNVTLTLIWVVCLYLVVNFDESFCWWCVVWVRLNWFDLFIYV